MIADQSERLLVKTWLRPGPSATVTRRKAPVLGSPCSLGVASVKPGQQSLEPSMIGIAAIVLFIVVIGALNLYEFGRLD
jgi:hypothetical protein